MVEDQDERILAELQKDGRATNQQLAETVGMSTSACWRELSRSSSSTSQPSARPIVSRAPAAGISHRRPACLLEAQRGRCQSLN